MMDDIWKWHMECAKVRKAYAKDASNNLPSRRFPKDKGTAEAVLDPIYKSTILAAARSIVSVTPISKDGPRRPQCTGFVIEKFKHSGSYFAVVVTCSKVLSVGFPNKKTFVEAKLLYFNDHYDIAFLLLPMESSLDLPCFGCCPNYHQEVFVLGRDKEAFLRVRRGVISWKEESDLMGHNYYMFLDGEIPEGGSGGPVIDHDGMFRGMAFYDSPKPVVLSVSTIFICFNMFVQFGYKMTLMLRVLASMKAT
ncbi:hypothetical protein PR202_ga18694 [Eleusine coracana subsp. coracana]|uniref:Uncharacterized protein n=1 Tax=Eleusine coracana subsp. coracana TaxID=191504 RepID=A0AAV5CTJ2_ELECO|nr:hypothetical protein PR202_ga18694 [Eleusine coracana subsp. coracana]